MTKRQLHKSVQLPFYSVWMCKFFEKAALTSIFYYAIFW